MSELASRLKYRRSIFLLLINQLLTTNTVQRKSSLSINYPVIARMRYLFELLKANLFANTLEKRLLRVSDKVDWPSKAAKNDLLFLSFSAMGSSLMGVVLSSTMLIVF